MRWDSKLIMTKLLPFKVPIHLGNAQVFDLKIICPLIRKRYIFIFYTGFVFAINIRNNFNNTETHEAILYMYRHCSKGVTRNILTLKAEK